MKKLFDKNLILKLHKEGKKVFASLVKPYIIKSMSYKLKNWTR